MTMDGHASNVSMCTKLRCDLKANSCEPLKTLKTYFPHPVTHDNVFVRMHACQMLKLTHNTLQVHADYCLFALVDFILLFIHFDCIYIIVENGALRLTCAVKKDSDSAGIQPNLKHHWQHQLEVHSSSEQCPKEK